jgi:UDP-N-acetylglucosamine--N-acetylmuramyl-(pentapeptide) pyrophosphoryl-undecaprenol N-acetylglucosamine transferase
MERAGAAVVIRDDELTPELLARAVAGIISDPARLAQMAAAARGLARPDAAREIAREVLAAAR